MKKWTSFHGNAKRNVSEEKNDKPLYCGSENVINTKMR